LHFIESTIVILLIGNHSKKSLCEIAAQVLCTQL
jgi:hypothetical protein